MATDERFQVTGRLRRHDVVCKDSITHLSQLIGDETVINSCELRRKMRRSVDTPKSWSEKMTNMRSKTLPVHFHNFRYGTLNIFQREENDYNEKHGRLKSYSDLELGKVKLNSSRILPMRPRKNADEMNEKSQQNRLSKPDIIWRERNRKNIATTKEKWISRESTLRASVNEFLAKQNPQKPPDSLRMDKIPRLIKTEPVISKRYSHAEDCDKERNVVNPNTAPTMQMFVHRPWNYQVKESWRYLRLKDPDPLSIDCIFKNNRNTRGERYF